MTYHDKCAALTDGVIASLKKNRVNLSAIRFGGPIPEPAQIRPPTFATSKFQQEQALGDWAESCVAKAVSANVRGYKAVHYGFSSKIVAGEPGFRDHYIEGVRDTCKHGKRADLLIVPKSVSTPSDISDVPTVGTRDIVSKSIGALEVRSSRFEVSKYVTYQRQRGSDATLSFTVKIEDLMKVYRWIEVFKKPQAYAQVFLDSVFGLSVLDILDYIARTDRLVIDEPQRSGKTTIMIPLSIGRQIGEVVEYPKFVVIDRVTANGRHDIFADVTPENSTRRN